MYLCMYNTYCRQHQRIRTPEHFTEAYAAIQHRAISVLQFA